MEFEWVLHEEVHSSLSQLRNILMVCYMFLESFIKRRNYYLAVRYVTGMCTKISISIIWQ